MDQAEECPGSFRWNYYASVAMLTAGHRSGVYFFGNCGTSADHASWQGGNASPNLLELLRKRGMDRDGDFLRELRVLVGRITVDGKTGAASAFSATGSVSQL